MIKPRERNCLNLQVSPSFIQFHTVSLSFTKFHTVSRSFTQFHTVSLSFTVFYPVSPCFLTCFTKFHHGIPKFRTLPNASERSENSELFENFWAFFNGFLHTCMRSHLWCTFFYLFCKSMKCSFLLKLAMISSL